MSRLQDLAQEEIQQWIFRNADVVTDAISGEEFRKLAAALRRIFEEPKGMRGVFEKLADFMLQDTRDVVSATVPGVQVEELSADVSELRRVWVRTNTDLIRDVGFLVEQVILRKLRGGGTTAQQLHEALQEALDASESKAKFWASDQMLKLHADLTEQRHKDVGVFRYSWTDSNDERVRERHAELGDMSDRGITFTYADPPIVDLETGRKEHPGKDFRCRCTAYPVLD